ncbi:unnamed protein product [Adineta ricciae]|uniref:G-protein coupled receptors family 1 profile domain-containing protein n=1 Tax=Adineta ricciae TaxID=249248 RepID=A0A815I904_ADIRI|nr:unnamed protein product [Adineta ricciae]
MTFNESTTYNLYIKRLENLCDHISTYVFLFYLIVGNIGNVFKVLFFSQKPLRSCPCTIYILVATIGHFLTLNNIPLSSLFRNNWDLIGFDHGLNFNRTFVENTLTSTHATRMCKIQVYFHMLSTNISLQTLVFASLNRFCMSLKRKTRLNKSHRVTNFFCTLSTAYILCTLTCIIWALVSIQTLFSFTIIHDHCIPHNIIVWGVKLSSIYFGQTIFMTMFGSLTIFYRHKRSLYVRRHQAIPMCSRYGGHDRLEIGHVEVQLTSMIVTEIVMVILSLLPYGIYIVYRLSTMEKYRSPLDMKYDNVIERFVQLTTFFEPSCGFYIYLFTLTTLKQRFFGILRRRLEMCH